MNYCVYILYSSSKDSYYVGSCEDINVRIAQHNGGRNKSTKSGVPWEIKKTESFLTRAEAAAREMFIKRMKSRKFIEMVISGER